MWLLAGVFAAVNLECLTVAEGGVAPAALVGQLPRVLVAVGAHLEPALEAFTTDVTYIRRFTWGQNHQH